MRRSPAGRGRDQLCREEGPGREKPTRVRPLALLLGAGCPLVSYPGAPRVAPRTWCPSLGAHLCPLGLGTHLCPSLTPNCVILDARCLFVPLPRCPSTSLWGLAGICVPPWAPTCVPVRSWANSCLSPENEQIPCLVSEGFVQPICLKPSLLGLDIDDPKLL